MIRSLIAAVCLAGLAYGLVVLAPLDSQRTTPLIAPHSVSFDTGRIPSAGRNTTGDARGQPSALVSNRANRNVTPQDFTHGLQDTRELTRVAPRPRFEDPTAETAEQEATAKAPNQPERPAEPAELVLLPRPIAIDAGHLTVGKATVTLPGIDPPSLDARCGEGAGAWPCGMRARTALRSYLRSRSVRCTVPDTFGDTTETIESACTLRGDDIGRWLVARGWARAEPGSPYETAETTAKRKRLGIWR